MLPEIPAALFQCPAVGTAVFQLDALEITLDRIEDTLDGVVSSRSQASHERDAGGHVVFHDGDACAILSTVVLLFHEQVQAAHAPTRIAVAFSEVAQGLLESDKREAALVSD